MTTSTHTAAPLVNDLGETFYRITLWADLARDHVVAHVWSRDAYHAITDVHLDYPAHTHRVVAVREGTSGDLD